MSRLLLTLVGACLASVTNLAQAVQTVILPANIGTIDESSLPLINFGSTGAAGLRPSAPSGSEALIRYLIPNTVVPGSSEPCIEIRFRDTGLDARVRVLVREIDLGSNRVLGGVFDSDDVDAGASPDFRIATHCLNPRPAGEAFFDFSGHAYVIEVYLRRIAPGGQPGIQAMQIANR